MSSQQKAGLATAGYGLAVAATGSLTFGAAAVAADLPRPVAVAPVIVRPPADPDAFRSWSVGAGIGYDIFRAPISISSYDNKTFDDFSDVITGAGPFITAEIGKDFRKGDTVFGVYADYARGSKAGTITHRTCDLSCIDTTATIQLGNSYSVIARLGHVTNPTTLVYGLAGATWQRYQATVSAFSDNWGDLPTAQQGGTMPGLVVGFGAEKMLNASWSIKGEYRYAMFQAIGAFSNSDCCTYVDVNIGHVTDQIARLIVSYKFH